MTAEAERLRARVRAHRDAILRVASEHHATNVRLFGSVARGDARPDSDVDLLVTFGPDATLLDQTALLAELRDLLGHPVDVVSDRALSPYLRADVLREAIPV